MEQKYLQQIKQKTTVNVLFLSLRNFGLQGISTIGFFALTLLLGTGEVGLFAIVAESVGILGYFSDVGLASALIQQKKKTTKSDLQTTFFIQQTLVVISLIVVALIYPRISQTKMYGDKELAIMVALCFSFFAASLKTIPSVILERNLNFKLISTIDIIENIAFYLIAVIFAYLHFGAYSYAIATFTKSLIGLILIYRFSPWSLGFSFSTKTAKKLFRFGIPFQINSFIALAKDRLSNLLVAGIIGRESFGILAWAQKGPRIPLSFMDAIMKVTFPTFSRLQNQPEILKNSIHRSTFFIAFFVFPSLAGISLIAPDVLNIIPRYSKWFPAIVPLYFYAASYALASVTTPLTNAFNAVGKITTTTKFMLMWTALTWIFFPILSSHYSFLGTAVASLIVSSSSILVWLIADKAFNTNIFSVIFHPLASTLLMIIFLIPLSLIIQNPFFLISSKVILGISIYTAYHLIFSRSQINWFFQQLKCLKNKN